MMGFPKNWAVAALMEWKHILKVGEILICLFSLQASHDEASPAPRRSTMIILAHYDKCPWVHNRLFLSQRDVVQRMLLLVPSPAMVLDSRTQTFAGVV